MNKKNLSIIFSLFLVGVFSVSCSNSEQTDPKGIEQYNGNSYVSAESFTVSQDTVYLWVSIKDGKAAMISDKANDTAPNFLDNTYFTVTGSGTDYSFSLPDNSGTPNSVIGTFKFQSDGSSVTVRYTKNPGAPQEMLNKDIVCNKKQ